MKTFKGRFAITILILLSIVSAACSSGIPKETAQTISQGDVGATPTNTATMPPTPTPTPTPTIQPTSTASQAELDAKWRTPIGSYVLLAGICQSAQETVKKQQNGEIDNTNLTGEILGIRLIVGFANQTLEQWTPDEAVAVYKTQVNDHLMKINGLIDQWSSKSKTTDQVSTELSSTCDAINKELQDMVVEAKNQGMTQETFNAIVDDIEESLAAGISSPSGATQTEPTATP